jgi:hydrogenase maturation protease
VNGERPRVVVIGIGNEDRGDDAVGLLVARRLRDVEGIEVREEPGEAGRLMDAWADVDVAILVDAVQSGEEVGAVLRLDASARSLPATIARASTHAFGVAEAVELARTLGKLPRTTIVFGIEGRAFDFRVSVTPEVEQAVGEVCSLVLAEISWIRACPQDASARDSRSTRPRKG